MVIDMNNGIVGYKAFYKGLFNRFEEKFEIGKRYVIDYKYRNYGYHFCKNMEDVLVYYRGEDIEICEVIGSGDIINYHNDYYGVYDVYASSEIEIVRKIDREEIINMVLNMNPFSVDRVVRFVSLYVLTYDEIKLFEDRYAKYDGVMDAINYYQKKDKKVYKRKYINN